jgi:exosortase/archaeosortase family protein
MPSARPARRERQEAGKASTAARKISIASWRSRLAGLALGILAIQIINLVRVVSLYLTGAYLPRFFDASHTVIWQSVVILCGVLLWVFWANRLPPQDEPAT